MTPCDAMKELEKNLATGVLDVIILSYLEENPIHGYRIITKIRKELKVYLGPSTIYPRLNDLEKKGLVISSWNTSGERARNVYTLTREGEKVLEHSRSYVEKACRKREKKDEIMQAIPQEPAITQ